jgi:replicative DNA helicase
MTDKTLDITEHKQVFGKLENIVKQTLSKNLHSTNIKSDGINSGFIDLDKRIKGFKKKELTTIAVRPGIGKTSFLLSMVNNIGICHNVPLALFSLERSADKIVQRIIESSTGLSIPKINKGEISDTEIFHVRNIAKDISKSAIEIIDDASITMNELIAKSKELVENGIEIIFIDYLELMVSSILDNESQNKELEEIVKTLNKLATDLNVPIVLFSQLSKPVVYSNKYKYTPDYINDNTDNLLFVNRPDFYHINQIDQKEKGIAEITIAKHKNFKEAEAIQLRFIETLDRFDNLN